MELQLLVNYGAAAMAGAFGCLGIEVAAIAVIGWFVYRYQQKVNDGQDSNSG